ncbi:hypothetical protein QO003_001747 [Arthrobacter silviterrae]|nr:hypothetical protein [Arthrobacter silviterrae]
MVASMASMIKSLALPHLVQIKAGGPGLSISPGRFAAGNMVMKFLPHDVHKGRT